MARGVASGLGPFLERRMRERQAYVARHAFPTRGDKVLRARSIRGRMALDGSHVPRLARRRQAFEAELLTFPAGRHDDQVHALGRIGQLLSQMLCGPAPSSKKRPLRDGCWRMFDEQESAEASRCEPCDARPCSTPANDR